MLSFVVGGIVGGLVVGALAFFLVEVAGFFFWSGR